MIFPPQFPLSCFYPHIHFTTQSPAPRPTTGLRAIPFQSLHRALLLQHCTWGTIRIGSVLAKGEFKPRLSSWEQKVEQKWEGLVTQVPICSLRAGGQSADIWDCSTNAVGGGLPNHPSKEKPNSCSSGQVCFLRQGFVIVCAQGLWLLQFPCPFFLGTILPTSFLWTYEKKNTKQTNKQHTSLLQGNPVNL